MKFLLILFSFSAFGQAHPEAWYKNTGSGYACEFMAHPDQQSCESRHGESCFDAKASDAQYSCRWYSKDGLTMTINTASRTAHRAPQAQALNRRRAVKQSRLAMQAMESIYTVSYPAAGNLTQANSRLRDMHKAIRQLIKMVKNLAQLRKGNEAD